MAASFSGGEQLVAREAELDRVLCVVDTVRAGRGRVVLFAGAPGVGKTLLAREVIARATRLRPFTGRCFEQHVAVPFFPFAELLEPALAAAPAALQATARRQWPALSFVIPGFDADRPQELDGREAQLHVFRATTAFLHALAEVQPLILLLDDLHWADSSSLSLLLFLGRNLDDARILILGTYRDVELGRQHPLEAPLRELIRQRLAEEIQVGPLTADGTAALVRARLGGGDVSDDLVALMHARAQGNPFFTEELLKEFVENGTLTTRQGHARPMVGSDLYLPYSIRSVISDRFGRLPPAVQEVLRLASLFGPEFELETLLASSGKAEVELLEALDAALDARIVVEVPACRERFAFAHALIQQTLYDELPIHRRRRMHLRIGEALLATPTGSAALSADLARHFLLGGDAARATSFAINAGDHAAARYAHAEAVHHYQVALELLADDEVSAARAAEIQIRLADELHDLNRLDEALAGYEAAGTRFEQLGDALGKARTGWGVARLHQGRYAMVPAEVHVDAALRLWPGEREDAEYVQLLVDAARIKTYLGAGQYAIPLAERAVALAERIGDAKLRARALFGLSVVPTSALPRPAHVISILDRAIPLAAQAADWACAEPALHQSRYQRVAAWSPGTHDCRPSARDRRGSAFG
jgi:predicted ATPase